MKVLLCAFPSDDLYRKGSCDVTWGDEKGIGLMVWRKVLPRESHRNAFLNFSRGLGSRKKCRWPWKMDDGVVELFPGDTLRGKKLRGDHFAGWGGDGVFS